MRAFKNYLLVEFEYDATLRPFEAGLGADERALAVCFARIEIICADTDASLGQFDFRVRRPPGVDVIYGLGHPEAWGAWSVGPRTALLLSLDNPPRGRIRIEITHSVIDKALPRVSASVRVNEGEEHRVDFSGGVAIVEVGPPEARAISVGAQNASHANDERLALSILIVNYERPDLVFACVTAALSAAIKSPYEIIVVDNGSDAASSRRLAEMELPVRLIALRHRRSFGEATNIAAEAARGEFLLLLNNDAFLAEGVIEKLLAEMSVEATGAVGPVFRFPDGSLQEMGCFVASDGITSSPIFNGLTWDTPDVSDVEYVSAACLLVRRADLLAIGGFAPEFGPAYCEDVDLCLRLQAAGKRTRLVKTAVVRHILNASSGKADGGAARHNSLVRNIAVFLSRWGRWLLTRDNADAPICAALDLERLRAQIARFPGERLHCVVPTRSLADNAYARAVVAASVALGNLRPTIVAAQTPYAVIDIASRARAMGAPHERLTSGGLADLELRDVDAVVVCGGAIRTALLGLARHRILHFPSPPEADDERSGRRLGDWLNFDAIVATSDFSRRACRHLMAGLGAPSIDIEVIPSVIDVFPTGDTQAARDNIIVSRGPLRAGPTGGGHESVLRAFRRFAAARTAENWRLVITGDLAPGDDAGYVGRLRQLERALDVDVMVEPPRPIYRRLLARSKIFVSAQGLGSETADEASQCPHSIDQVGTAISAGCVLVVFGAGAEAEFCEAEGIGFTFHDKADLPTALEQAADLAEREGLALAQRKRMEAFAEAAHREAWAKLISRLDAAADAENHSRKKAKAPRRPSGAVPALVVVGCHRSGTSAMARVLSIAGADLPSDIMVPQADNPTGFWEPAAIAEWNEQLFKSQDSSWDDEFAFFTRSRFANSREGHVEKAIALIRECYSGARPIALKDPRISVIAPLWDSALRASRYQPNYIVMVRDPREVAASLTARNDFSIKKGLLLWASYMLSIEKDTRDAPRLFVAYRDLIDDPAAVLKRVRSRLGVALPKSAGAGRRIATFLNSSLRHQKFDSSWSEEKTAAINDYYQSLLGAARDAPLLDFASDRLETWLIEMRKSSDPDLTENARDDHIVSD